MAILSAAIAAADDLVARGEALFADIEKFDVNSLVQDVKTDISAVVATDLPALKAEAVSIMAGVNAKLSAIGQGLHALGLASAGPNVDNSTTDYPSTGSGAA